MFKTNLDSNIVAIIKCSAFIFTMGWSKLLNSTCEQFRKGFEGVLSVMLRYNAETGNSCYYSVGWHWSSSSSETVQVRTC